MVRDKTPVISGRLTLNPIAHMDLLGTFLLPLMVIVFNAMGAQLPLFGWAKPVPIDIRQLRHPKRDLLWVALAGPFSNVLLALLGVVVLMIIQKFLIASLFYRGFMLFWTQFVVTNLFLAFFNALPIHPLDGSRIVSSLLPTNWAYHWERLENTMSLVLLMLILMGGLRFLGTFVLLTARWLFQIAQVTG